MDLIIFIILILFALMLFGAIFKGKDESYAKGISKGCGTILIPIILIIILIVIIAVFVMNQ